MNSELEKGASSCAPAVPTRGAVDDGRQAAFEASSRGQVRPLVRAAPWLMNCFQKGNYFLNTVKGKSNMTSKILNWQLTFSHSSGDASDQVGLILLPALFRSARCSHGICLGFFVFLWHFRKIMLTK